METRTAKTAGYSLGKGIGLALVSVVGLFVIVYTIGQATASASVSARCEPFLAPSCRLTIANHSFWPEQIDLGSIMVNGQPARSIGSGIAWPFGSGSMVLYDRNGPALRTMHTIAFREGPVLGPSRFAQSITLQASTPAANEHDTTRPAGDDERETPEGHAAGHGKALGTGRCKPGHGYGDTNHCHSGPPGQQG